jgi:hypothetical protein
MSLSNEDGPAELVPPQARTIGGNPIIERRKPPSGDPFTAKTPRPDEKRLAVLEERLAHELLGDEERQELRDRVLRLREAVQKVRGER